MHFVFWIYSDKPAFEFFSFSSTLKLICVNQKLADHPYFTRSKGPTNSFPRQSSDKAMTVMGDSNKDVSLIDVLVAQPTVADQDELILQLMQQIEEMRVKMQRRQDLPPPGFAANAANGRPPIYFPSSNMDPAQNQPSTPAQNSSIMDLTTQNPQYASASYQTQPPSKKTTPKCRPILKIPTIKPLYHCKIN